MCSGSIPKPRPSSTYCKKKNIEYEDIMQADYYRKCSRAVSVHNAKIYWKELYQMDKKRAKRMWKTEPAGAKPEQLRADWNWCCWCSKHPPVLTTTKYLCCHNWQFVMACFVDPVFHGHQHPVVLKGGKDKLNGKDNHDHIDLLTTWPDINQVIELY